MPDKPNVEWLQSQEAKHIFASCRKLLGLEDIAEIKNLLAKNYQDIANELFSYPFMIVVSDYSIRKQEEIEINDILKIVRSNDLSKFENHIERKKSNIFRTLSEIYF